MKCWLFSHCLHAKSLTIPILFDCRPPVFNSIWTPCEKICRKALSQRDTKCFCTLHTTLLHYENNNYCKIYNYFTSNVTADVFTSRPLPPRTLSQAAATSLVIPLLLPRHLRPMTTTFPFCQPTPLPPRPIHLQELNFTAYFLFHCSFLLAPLPRIRPTGADVLEGNLIEWMYSEWPPPPFRSWLNRISWTLQVISRHKIVTNKSGNTSH